MDEEIRQARDIIEAFQRCIRIESSKICRREQNFETGLLRTLALAKLLVNRYYSLTNHVVSGFVESLRKADGVSQFRQYHTGALPVQDVYYVYYVQKGFVFGIGYVSKRGE